MDKEVLEKANELMRQIGMLEQTIEDAKIVKNNADGKARVGIQIGNIRYMYVRPEKLKSLCEDAINSIFDVDQYEELLSQESIEKDLYQTELKKYVNTL